MGDLDELVEEGDHLEPHDSREKVTAADSPASSAHDHLTQQCEYLNQKAIELRNAKRETISTMWSSF